jgi:hypothetical protein
MLGLVNMSGTYDLGPHVNQSSRLLVERAWVIARYDLMSVSSHAFATIRSPDARLHLWGDRFRFTKHDRAIRVCGRKF